jgi:hypothetical protein
LIGSHRDDPGQLWQWHRYQPSLTDALSKNIPCDRTVWVADSELGVIQFTANPIGLGYMPPFSLSYYKYTGATADFDTNNNIIYNIDGGIPGGLTNFILTPGHLFNIATTTELFSVNASANLLVGAPLSYNSSNGCSCAWDRAACILP